MRNVRDIQAWLHIAFSERAGGLNETYYFDREANEFYSVFFTDYFLLFDDDGDVHYAGLPYTGEEFEILRNRIEREEANDPSIVYVPRLSIDERKELMQSFADTYNLETNSAVQQLIDAQDYRSELSFGNLLSPEHEEEWQSFNAAFIQPKIDSFCNLNGIDLETATLFTDEKCMEVTIKVNDDAPKEAAPAVVEEITSEPQNHVKPKKPWWKFW